MKPLVIDGYCGLGGWTEGFLAEGWECIGIDIERHDYGNGGYPAKLILQDMLTVNGADFKHADCFVFSPPCQFFSYTAMPWSRAKKLAAEVRADPVRLKKELALFQACFRIQREAVEAAGHFIPMVVENVCGAQPWVGRAKAKCGSFLFWGDVPILMPFDVPRKQDGDSSWFFDNYKNSARSFCSKSKERRAWSAQIAKIPIEISRHIARVYYPCGETYGNEISMAQKTTFGVAR